MEWVLLAIGITCFAKMFLPLILAFLEEKRNNKIHQQLKSKNNIHLTSGPLKLRVEAIDGACIKAEGGSGEAIVNASSKEVRIRLAGGSIFRGTVNGKKLEIAASPYKEWDEFIFRD